MLCAIFLTSLAKLSAPLYINEEISDNSAISSLSLDILQTLQFERTFFTMIYKIKHLVVKLKDFVYWLVRYIDEKTFFSGKKWRWKFCHFIDGLQYLPLLENRKVVDLGFLAAKLGNCFWILIELRIWFALWKQNAQYRQQHL